MFEKCVGGLARRPWPLGEREGDVGQFVVISGKRRRPVVANKSAVSIR